jgi:integrase
MAVEYRKNRRKWGYRFHYLGNRFERFVWRTKGEAREAERARRVELKNNPPAPPTALVMAGNAYIAASAERGRSQWRLDGLGYVLAKHIYPFFGSLTLLCNIKPDNVEKFIRSLKAKRLKNKTIKNIITDLRALYNWAMEDEVRLATRNPVTKEKFALIGSTRFVKPPLNPKDFDTASQAIEDKRDRAWFDVTRFTGMRKDEANRLQWLDVNWDLARIRIPGTKTEESEVWLPLAPAALETLRALYDSEDRDPNCEYVFPGRSARTKGKKIYSRRRIFERIQRVTAVKRYMQQHPAASSEQALEACRKEKFKGGMHLKPKDLRDYFGTQIAGKVADATVVMRLMRHTSLDTTTKYMRTVDDRMAAALDATFGRNSVSRIGPKTASAEVLGEFEEFLQWKKNRNRNSWLQENFQRRFGGGGQTRTVDSADMSRVL